MPETILNITVNCPGQEDVVFKVCDDTKLTKLMERYCSQILNKNTNSVVFTYEGIEVKKEDTPKKLHMKDQDVIHVNMMQTGGCDRQPIRESPALD